MILTWAVNITLPNSLKTLLHSCAVLKTGYSVVYFYILKLVTNYNLLTGPFYCLRLGEIQWKDVNLLQKQVLIAVNLQTSFLTPPFGFALFYLRGVAPNEVKTSQIYTGVIPFIVIQLTGLSLFWVFPSIVTWLPEVIFGYLLRFK